MRGGTSFAGDASQTVLSSFVLLSGDGQLTLLAWGSGTKFAPVAAVLADGGSGAIVRDCHAEVLARRALLRCFYAEARSLLCGGASAALELCEGEGGPRYRLRRGARLLFYSSSMPCGTSRCCSFRGPSLG